MRRDHSSAGRGLVGDVDGIVGHALTTVAVRVVIGAGLFTEPGVLSIVEAVNAGVVPVKPEEQEDAKVLPGDKFKESSLGVMSRAVGDDDGCGDGFGGARSRPEGSGVIVDGRGSRGAGHVFFSGIAWAFMLFRGVCR